MSVKRRGSTIIFVLFVMIVAMIITTTVTTIVLNNLRSTTAAAQQAHSYYAAQSNMERGLFYAFSQRGQYTYSAAQVASTINAFTQSLSNGSSTTVVANTENVIPEMSLDAGESAELAIYAEDSTNGYQLVPLNGLSALIVNWTEDTTCTAGTSQLEVGYTRWTADQWEDLSNPQDPITHFTYTCALGAEYQGCAPASLGLDPNYLYRVKLKALNCKLNYVGASIAYDSTGPQLLPQRLRIDSVGKYADTQRGMGVTMPWSQTSSAYTDFVLFSEDAITK